MLGMPLSVLQQCAEELAARLRAIAGIAAAEVEQDVAFVGGGSLPDQQMKTWVVAAQARALDETTFAQRLRLGDPAVMGRVRDGKIVLDVRTVFPEQMDELAQALAEAVNLVEKK